MTMGQLSKWLSNIKTRKDRQDISRFYGLNEKVFTSYCEHISLVRNTAAHHARLWNRDFSKIPILPRRGDPDLINSLSISSNTNRKIYNSLVILTYLMHKICGDNCWKNNLIQLIDSHAIDTTKMGFPTDWETKSLWQ